MICGYMLPHRSKHDHEPLTCSCVCELPHGHPGGHLCELEIIDAVVVVPPTLAPAPIASPSAVEP